MAIDTRSKRFAMLGFALIDTHLFEADGTIDADDRASLLAMYGGIAKDNPPPPADSSLMDDKLIITIGIGI